ncbi:hypothetical protein [Granulicella sp. dw_53]|uniref:hypothetical protein n=1 Tax=Granulicella sp. dw_53 TaxID=2719792 RepID=UPI001BD31812|nr:hypothetical protein [Granulicella sp. dw_53]
MAEASEIETQTGPRTLGGGYLFGVPVGDLGWFASLLMSLASGFVAFFMGTFLGIVGIPIVNSLTHKGIDLSWSYKGPGLCAGITVLAVALAYLGTLWAKRHLRRS